MLRRRPTAADPGGHRDGCGPGRGRQAARLWFCQSGRCVSRFLSAGSAVIVSSPVPVPGRQARLSLIPSPRGHGALRPRSVGVNQKGDHATGWGS